MNFLFHATLYDVASSNIIMVPKLPIGYRQIIKRSCAISDFVLSDTFYNPRNKLADHVHENFSCALILEGTFEENCVGDHWICKAPGILFRLPNEVHSNQIHDQGAHLLIVEISNSMVERITECGGLPERSFVSEDPLLTGLSVKVYKEFTDMDDFSEITIEGLMLEIIAGTLRDRASDVPKRPLWLERAKELIHYEFSNHLTVNEIARRVGVHPVHLAREFQKHFQRSIGEYIRELRVHMACRELSNTDRAIFEIAYEAGFSDHSHFCRTFKKILGLTPAEYRTLFHAR